MKKFINIIVLISFLCGDCARVGAVEVRKEALANRSFVPRAIGVLRQITGSVSNEELNKMMGAITDALFVSLLPDDREELIAGLEKYEGQGAIILDSSCRWAKNSRSGEFIGNNRRILEKLSEVSGELDEEKGKEKKDEEKIKKLELEKKTLEAYLMTYIYHELRHEAFIGERRVLNDFAYETMDDLGLKTDANEYAVSNLKILLGCLSEEKRKKFEDEVERRQNGYDAKFFLRLVDMEYEESIQVLFDMDMVNRESKFADAVVIAGFADRKSKHYNELVIEDFKDTGVERIVYEKHEQDYVRGNAKEREDRELVYRGKITYMLYQVGLTSQMRVEEWRQKKQIQKEYDRELAKKYILRLIDFVSRYTYDTDYVDGRGTVLTFKKREKQLEYKDAAQLLSVSLLSNGSYSQAVLRTQLAFKTSGLVNTVVKSKFEFWKLVEETCSDMVKKGDIRFSGITAEAMKSASVEKEMLPRLRIVCLFQRYLNTLPAKDFPKPFRSDKEDRGDMDILCSEYNKYRRGQTVTVDVAAVDKFDKLYAKICKVLAKKFGIDGAEWKDVFDIEDEENDLLLALWSTFNFAENLITALSFERAGQAPNRTLHFTEPLFETETPGGEPVFTEKVLDAVIRLKAVFDKADVLIETTDINDSVTAEDVRMILRVYKTKILKRRQGLSNILARYGTERDADGHKAWELMRQTHGWASCVWLAREYGQLFKDGKVKKAMDLDVGNSVFYEALFQIEGMAIDKLAGITDIISNRTAEYFGSNPNRIAGDIGNGALRNIMTGEQAVLEPESCELVTSIYRLHEITSPQKMFNIFKNAHRVLKYGGQFAITLPAGRAFNEEALAKMGFKPVVGPVVAWNEPADTKDAEKTRELKKRKFHVVILEKVDVVKSGKDGLEKKSDLLPIVLEERKTGVLPDLEEKIPTGDAGFEGKGVSGGVEITVGGLAATTGQAAVALAKGLAESSVLKEKAEKAGTISVLQGMIRGALDEVVSPDGKKIEGFVEEPLKSRIDKAIKYNDSDYTQAVEDELTDIISELEKLKKSVKEDLEKEKKDAEQAEKDKKYVDDNWDKFEELRKTIRKYEVFGDKLRKDVNDILDAGKDKLTESVMERAKQVINKIAQELFGETKTKKTIEDFEGKIKDLFEHWMACEFLFTVSDMEFLARIKIEWEKEKLGEETARGIQHLRQCLKVVEDWRGLKELIEWDQGLAVILQGKEEKDYMAILDEELLYKRFRTEKGISEGVIPIVYGMTGEKISEEMMTQGSGLAINEGLVLAVDDCFDISDKFLSAVEKMGFEVRSFYEVWLEPGEKTEIKSELKDEVQGFIKRGKKMIVLRKKTVLVDVNADLLNLSVTKREEQDYSKFFSVREYVLQSLDASKLQLKSKKLLSQAQIKRLYKEWAGKFLGKGDWTAVYFEEARVKLAVAEYGRGEKARKQKEKARDEVEKARKAREEAERKKREKDLIKLSDTPLVKITYEGVWAGQESAVRDLAQILLKMDVDFDKEPDFEKILGDECVANHPQLNKIPPDDLKAKIKELWEYRRYETQIFRLYSEFVRIIFIIYEDMAHAPVSNDEKKEFVTIDEESDTAWWHMFCLDNDELSPFGLDLEMLYEDIMGRYMSARFNIQDNFKQRNKRIVIHNLGAGNMLRRVVGEKPEIIILSGTEILTIRKSVLEEMLPSMAETKRAFDRVMAGSKEIVNMLIKIGHAKNIHEDKVRETGELLDMYYTFMNVSRKDPKLDENRLANKIQDISTQMTAGLRKLFSGQMTKTEYEEFISRIKNMMTLPASGAPAARVLLGMTGLTGESAFKFYMYGQGQEKEMSVTKDDPILSEFAEGKAKVKYYFDALKLLKGVQLYQLSDEERKVLDELIEDLPENSEKATAEIIAYIKTSNSVNRYVYFRFRYFGLFKRHVSTRDMEGFLTNVEEGVKGSVPKINVYIKDMSDFNLIVLLTELYRLNQMLEDKVLEEEKLEVQLTSIEIMRAIRTKMFGGAVVRDLSKLKDGTAILTQLEDALAGIGNIYHKDFISNMLVSVTYLQEVDEYRTRALFESIFDKDTADHFLTLVMQFVMQVYIYLLYFPEHKEGILRNLANIIKKSGENKNAQLFIQKLEKLNPAAAGELRGFIGESRASRMTKNDIPELQEMANIVIDTVIAGDGVPENMHNMIQQNQAFRSCLMTSICIRTKTEQREAADFRFGSLMQEIVGAYVCPNEVFTVLGYIGEEYETNEVIRGLDKTIISAALGKLMDFLRACNDKQIRSMLTRTFNQYLLLMPIVVFGMSINDDFRMYIADLFSKGEVRVSAYASYYVMEYFKSRRAQGGIEVHDILLHILNALTGEDGRIDNVKFIRVLELLACAVKNIPSITLKDEWDLVIQKYRDGIISKETLLAIADNAECAAQDLPDNAIARFVIRDGDGRNVLLKAAGVGEPVEPAATASGKTRDVSGPAKDKSPVIKRTDKPVVAITYDDFWTESTVRDLAQILLKLVPDFDKIADADILRIMDSPMFKNHPKLGTISRGPLFNKIGELIKYRQYELAIERVGRGSGTPMDGSLPNLQDLWEHEYRIESAASPFAMTPEELHDEIIGRYLSLRHKEIDGHATDACKLEPAEKGRDLYDYFLYGQGQEQEMVVSESDGILSKFAGGRTKIKYYFDLLKFIKSMKLYELCGEEKNILDGLVGQLTADAGDAVYDEIKQQVVSYIAATNSVNRYLYFRFRCLSRVGADVPIVKVNEVIDFVTGDTGKSDSRIAIYKGNGESVNIIALVTEFCRLNQMLGSALTDGEKTEILMVMGGIFDDVDEKIGKDQTSTDLSKIRDGSAVKEELKQKILEIVDVSYRDFLKDMIVMGKKIVKMEKIINKFVNGTYSESFHAYEYLRQFVMECTDDGFLHVLFTRLLNGLSVKEDCLIGTKLQRTFELFSEAVNSRSRFMLSEEWGVLIKKCKRGKISIERLSAIGRRANYALEDMLADLMKDGTFTQAEIDDRGRRFGLKDANGEDIFEKAIREHVVDKLTALAGDKKCTALKQKLDKIIRRVQENKKIGLESKQVHSLILLIDKCRDHDFVPEIAEILSIIFDEGYTGDKGRVIMAAAEVILVHRDAESRSQGLGAYISGLLKGLQAGSSIPFLDDSSPDRAV